MASVNGKDAYYFPHDCNARNDNKLLALRSVYGNEGYALYFMLIEILREQPSYRYPVSKYMYETLAMQLQCDRNKIEKLINDCCNEFSDEHSSLLSVNDTCIWSESLLKRMKRYDEIGEKRRQAANTRWGNASEMQMHSNGNTKRTEQNIKKQNNISKPSGENDLFNTFWKAYPKRVSKPQALKAFNKIKPDEQLLQQMLSALEKQKSSPDWTKDGGRFVPFPSTWLNDCRWEDESATGATSQGKELPYLC